MRGIGARRADRADAVARRETGDPRADRDYSASALGAERGQILRVYLGKGLGMGVSGVLLGTLAGFAFALVLIYVVNRAFFGWTIAVYWPFGVIARQNLVVLGAAALASLYPAWLASRTPATELRREDL